MDETIPELHPLPKEVTRRRWCFFCRRKRECRVRVVLEQMRYTTDNVYSDGGRWRIVMAVGEEREQVDSMPLQLRGVETHGFVHDLARPGRCGTEVELTWTLMVQLLSDPKSKDLPRHAEVMAQKRKYHCPGHVDDETFTVRASDSESSYQFDFQFRVELTCS